MSTCKMFLDHLHQLMNKEVFVQLTASTTLEPKEGAPIYHHWLRGPLWLTLTTVQGRFQLNHQRNVCTQDAL